MPKVISSSVIRTVINGGRAITAKYATKTDAWHRVLLSPEIQEEFATALEKAPIPANAAIAIMTETEHPSKKDSYPHYTTVYQDAAGNHITTKHVYR
ncbi:uncharacterized protein THITE_2116226 [Thermothielavioides terrestris NRRL 8126]|uniref:Uncharacterized protein n=1 Tax=Thermothielavioides terrestris (strain ATCC 38088 / NRRL 8126) TaxID=578455 RepID=G2R0S3_THETT|nr:uncharacterized protein THITE_2116226 [Thermothielavioides terrestris NRRL 8126]AEO67334.1 hypothetical protein THITE_2116226 [Thermothielavioides terrestris NRRL 8126]